MTFRRTHPEPSFFTPDDEPYRDLDGVIAFDAMIVELMKKSRVIAALTEAQDLSGLQRAVAQIVPQGINLGLGIRELIRQAHLFSAAVLLRSLVEQAAIVHYLLAHPDAIPVWEAGWNHSERPSLKTMLGSFKADADQDVLRQVCELLNHLTHGDPVGAEFNAVYLSNRARGYVVGRITTDPEFCDFVCSQAVSWLVVLRAVMEECFPSPS